MKRGLAKTIHKAITMLILPNFSNFSNFSTSADIHVKKLLAPKKYTVQLIKEGLYLIQNVEHTIFLGV